MVLLKNYLKIADASDVELKGCLEVSRRYKLDPFKQGQIWFVKRWDKNAVALNGTKGAYIYTPQVGIYGMLHIAARDHKDFGSISEAEYGPMFTHTVEETHKIKAPEWCRVKAYKKGIEQPTVATIYFEEFCPALWDNARLFWARMPRAQIEKCAKARVLRTAYPDLGGLYIPEEMDRMKDDVTPSGRQIVHGGPTGAPTLQMTPEAQEAIEELKTKGLWCEEHNCTRGSSHLKVCESSRKAIESLGAAQTNRGEKSAAGEGVSNPTAPKKSSKVPESEYRKDNVPPATSPPPMQFKGTITIDWTIDPAFPRITGDIADLLFPKDLVLKRKEDFWHAFAEDAKRLREVGAEQGFKIEEILPAKTSPQRHDAEEGTAKRGAGAGRDAPSGAPASPAVVSGLIEQANPESGKVPRVSVLLKVDKTKYWMNAFDTALFGPLMAGKGKQAELYVKVSEKGDKTYRNIVGLKRVGATEYDEDGKTPVIQRKDQEAGGRTLFGQ